MIFFIIAFVFIMTGCTEKEGSQIIGAIRWDAWHSSKGGPGLAVEKSLGPLKWHYRLPFYANVISDNEVKIDGSSQEIMDKEIEYAHEAGLDYWAFVTYPPNSALSLGIQNYLASKKKNKINFCLIVELVRLGSRKNYQSNLKRYIEYMKDLSYQKVDNNRPLMYLGFLSEDMIKTNWDSIENLKSAIDELRLQAQNEGLENPYIVIMDFDPSKGKKYTDALGCDAISSYAINAGQIEASYSELAAQAQSFWEKGKKAGANVVPIVTAGWDRRPRVENPVPWEKQGVTVFETAIKKFYETPTPDELAAHLKSAVDWVKENPDVTPSKAIIIYAWNENDEGGWLVPTISEGTARIDAIKKVLKHK